MNALPPRTPPLVELPEGFHQPFSPTREPFDLNSYTKEECENSTQKAAHLKDTPETSPDDPVLLDFKAGFDQQNAAYRKEIYDHRDATLAERSKDVTMLPHGLFSIKSVGQLELEIDELEYILENVLATDYCSIITATKGSYKSTLMAYLAVMITAGRSLSPELPILKQGMSLLLAGENPRDVKTQVLATMQYHNIDPINKEGILILPASMALDENVDKLIQTLAAMQLCPTYIGIDTIQAYSANGDTNNPAVAKQFQDAATKLKHATKAHVQELGHPPKSQEGQRFLEPYGGGSLVNAADGLATLAVEKKNGRTTIILRKNAKWREGSWHEIHFDIELVEDCPAAVYMGRDPVTGASVRKCRAVPVVAGVQLYRQFDDAPKKDNVADLKGHQQTAYDLVNAYMMANDGAAPEFEHIQLALAEHVPGKEPKTRKYGAKRVLNAMTVSGVLEAAGTGISIVTDVT